jgi:hypothetical protein
MGREVKNRQAQLQQDAWSLLKVDVTCRILKNTGHEFNEPQMAVVRDWLQTDVMKGRNSQGATNTVPHQN